MYFELICRGYDLKSMLLHFTIHEKGRLIKLNFLMTLLIVVLLHGFMVECASSILRYFFIDR